jgi:hypothetical protein
MVDAAAPAAVLVLAAEAIGPMLLRNGRCGFDERRGRGEIRDPVMGWPISGLVRGSPEGGPHKERHGQNESERGRRLEVSVHRDPQVSEAPFAEALGFYASPTSTIGVPLLSSRQ